MQNSHKSDFGNGLQTRTRRGPWRPQGQRTNHSTSYNGPNNSNSRNHTVRPQFERRLLLSLDKREFEDESRKKEVAELLEKEGFGAYIQKLKTEAMSEDIFTKVRAIKTLGKVGSSYERQFLENRMKIIRIEIKNKGGVGESALFIIAKIETAIREMERSRR